MRVSNRRHQIGHILREKLDEDEVGLRCLRKHDLIEELAYRFIDIVEFCDELQLLAREVLLRLWVGGHPQDLTEQRD